MTDKSVFKSEVANVQYGDVSKQAKFEVASLASDGETVLTAVAKPPKGHKYAVLLLGTMHKDDNPLDFDLDEALDSIGFVSKELLQEMLDKVQEPDDADQFWHQLANILNGTHAATNHDDTQEEAE